ncbi:hypothetical protein GGS23DRAFT_551686 [Durotheca rogersii]|uniref:uncharacterized protein n=1 Tax=Durotheca rogersii TaxID=419775 RepID=UPI0022201F81|nr:uncharacterized protein GGS23DRAFT_551686 [Durotheca rogersii]KAI5866707.1 hypothetical protein GGS23DRAFT_551686 [Durotheca rogersii]
MTDFEFVNVARPNDVTRHSTRIRRHVMKDIGRARRKPRAKKRRETPPRGSSSAVPGGRAQEPRSTPASLPSPLLNPPADNSLHTTMYPANMSEAQPNLVRFVVDEQPTVRRPFRLPWLSMGLSDSAVWYLTLANAALHRGPEPGSTLPEINTDDHAMSWYALSLASVTRRLQDPVESRSEGLITAVAGLAYHDSSVGNFGRFCTHMNRLQRIVDSNGGLRALSSPSLQIFVSWLDLIGATYFNAKPRFTVPEGSIKEIDTGNDCWYLEQVLSSWNADCPSLGDIMGAMKATAAVASYINRHARDQGFWEDDVTVARLLGPALHEILSLEGRALPNDPTDPEYSGTAAREAFRRAVLVLLGEVRARTGAGGAPELARHLDAFRQISQLPFVDWSLVPELNLWAHVTSALREQPPDRAWHVLTIVGLMESMGLGAAAQALDVVRGIIWVDAVDEGRSAPLCREIDALARANILRRLRDIPLDPRLDDNDDSVASGTCRSSRPAGDVPLPSEGDRRLGAEPLSR